MTPKAISQLFPQYQFSIREAQEILKTPLVERTDADIERLNARAAQAIVGRNLYFVLTQIIAAYERLVARSRGETEAEVTAARALSDGEIAELKSVLKSKLGKEPRLQSKIDPTLLGGLVVKVGSRMIDTSLRTKLNGLRAAMRG